MKRVNRFFLCAECGVCLDGWFNVTVDCDFFLPFSRMGAAIECHVIIHEFKTRGWFLLIRTVSVVLKIYSPFTLWHVTKSFRKEV